MTDGALRSLHAGAGKRQLQGISLTYTGGEMFRELYLFAALVEQIQHQGGLTPNPTPGRFCVVGCCPQPWPWGMLPPPQLQKSSCTLQRWLVMPSTPVLRDPVLGMERGALVYLRAELQGTVLCLGCVFNPQSQGHVSLEVTGES